MSPPVGAARSGVVGTRLRDVIPDSVVDDFEEGQYEDKGNTLSTYYGGNTSGMSRQTATVFNKSYALDYDRTSSGAISSTSGLNTYPSAGDTFRFALRSTGSDAGNSGACYGVQSVAIDSSIDCYLANIHFGNGTFELTYRSGGSFSTMASTSVSVSASTWYEIEVDWGGSGSHTATLYDSGGNSIDSITASDSNYSTGGIGWRSGGSPLYFDHYRIL